MYVLKKKYIKSSQTASNKYVLDTKCQLSVLSTTLTEMISSIAAFSGKPQETTSSEANSGQEAPVWGDAVNSFGGPASKRTKVWLESPLALALFGLMIFIKSYLLTRLGGNMPARSRIMKTSQIEQLTSSVWHKMGPTRFLSSSRSVCNSDNEYHGSI